MTDETTPDADRREAIREHLVSCSDCSAWLLEYAAFADEGAEDGASIDEIWSRHRERVRDRILEQTRSRPEPAPRLLWPRRVARVATQATLAAACLILSVLLWQARQEIQQPLESFEMRLEPVGQHRGPAPPPPPSRPVFRPPAGHRLVVTLDLPAGVRAPDQVWAAEILPPSGEGPGYVQRATPLLRGAVQVELPPDPAPGQYRVNLYRFQGQTAERVARYGFRIGLPEEVPEEPAAPPP